MSMTGPDDAHTRPIDPQKWADMDPLVRSRFHEMGNHIMRLEGIIAGLSMRVPEKPEEVPVLKVEVAALKENHKALDAAVRAIDSKLDSLTVRIVGGTTLLTAAVTGVVQYLTR